MHAFCPVLFADVCDTRGFSSLVMIGRINLSAVRIDCSTKGVAGYVLEVPTVF